MRKLKQYFHCLFYTSIQIIQCSQKCHLELTISFKGEQVIYGCSCGKIFGKHSVEERIAFDCFNDAMKNRYHI